MFYTIIYHILFLSCPASDHDVHFFGFINFKNSNLKQKPEEDRHFVLKNGLHKKIANNPRRAQAIYITRAGPRPGAGGGVREILPYPSTLVGYPIPLLSSSYPDTFKRKHDKPSYYLKFSANPLREHVKFLSRHTRWVAGSCALLAYRFLQDGFYVGFLRN